MKKDELLKGTGHLKDIGLSKGFKFWDEFKAFAFKGNMIDLAVAVILGGAFGAVINSLVKDIIMPALAYVLPGNQEYTKWTIGSAAKPVHVGTFLGEIVNFL